MFCCNFSMLQKLAETKYFGLQKFLTSKLLDLPHPHQERFRNIPVHIMTLLHSKFDIRTVSKRKQTSKMLSRSPNIQLHTLIKIDAVTSTFSKSSVNAPSTFLPVHTTTCKRFFQKDPSWTALSQSFAFGD